MRKAFYVELRRAGNPSPEASDRFEVFDEMVAWLDDRMDEEPSLEGRIVTSELITRAQLAHLSRYKIELF